MKLYTMPRLLRLLDRSAVYELRDTGCAALTFDDGPDPVYTPRILDRLAARSVRATFFILGEKARRYPDIVRRIRDEGHSLGVHGYEHRQMMWGRTAAMAEAFEYTARMLEDIAGMRPCLMRPPYGRMKRGVRRRLSRHGYVRVLWSLMPYDFLCPGTSAIVRATLDHFRPGAIICLHDGGGDRSQTVEALDGIIDGVPKDIRWVALQGTAV